MLNGWDGGVAGMLGRPDLATGWGVYVPATGQPATSLTPVSGFDGGSMIQGGVSVSGDVGTGQATLGLAAAMTVLFMVLYFATRSHQR